MHPYGLFIFALFYNIFLRGSITFCDFWNPITSMADLLLSDPDPSTQSDHGSIIYPQPIISLADLVLSHPDPVIPDSSSSSDSSDSFDHTLDPSFPNSGLIIYPHSLQGLQRDLPLSDYEHISYRAMVGNPYFTGLIHSHVYTHNFLYSMYGGFPIQEPLPSSSLADEPALSESSVASDSSHDSFSDSNSDISDKRSSSESDHYFDDYTEQEPSPLQQSFNNFVSLAEQAHGKPTIQDMRTYINYVRDTMPKELWSEKETYIDNLINGLDDTIILPNDENIMELIYYKSAITVYNVLQDKNLLHDNAALYQMFEQSVLLYSNHYFSS